MRLWSLHPRYLDRRGLVALWREALLAQAVLRGGTRGYRHHPQLSRFSTSAAPLDAIAMYLGEVLREATRRGYAFDASKVPASRTMLPIAVTEGQLAHEWRHLQAKLASRDPAALERLGGVDMPECHPLFRICAGGVETWERPAPVASKSAGPGKPAQGLQESG